MNWIDDAYPPDCLAVLLFVVEYRDYEVKNRIIDMEYICLGYYSNDDKKYYIEHPSKSTLSVKKYEIETDCIKVIAWTLLPRITSQLKKILKQEEEFHNLLVEEKNKGII